MAKKGKDIVADSGEEMSADHAELRVYELGFHLDPDLSADEAKKAYVKLRGKIEDAGTIIAEGEPQRIQLAYTISRTEQSVRRDFTASYFSWIAYEADGKGHASVIEAVAGEKSVFRHLDIRTTKDEAKHSAEMYEIMRAASAKAEEGEAEEEVSDTELDAALKEVGV